MLQTGTVTNLNAGMAEVEIARSSSCGDSCASCGLCPGNAVRVAAKNSMNASPGDTVVISMSDKKILGAAFLVYIAPLIALIAGYFIGNELFKSELRGILSGFVLMAASFVVIAAADRKMRRSYTAQIVEIISSHKKS